MATSYNNMEDTAKLSTSSNSNANIRNMDSNWWLKHLQKESKNNDNYIITNLVAELAILLNDKIRLEGENAVLQIENEDLRKKKQEIETNYEKDKVDLTNKINNLQEIVKQYEVNIKQVNIEHLEEAKTYISDISTLKEQYRSLKELSDRNTRDFKKIINDLEQELQAINCDNSELLQQVKIDKAKLQKYREKLKSSSNMICKLNSIVSTNINKSLSSKKTQTDDANNMCMEPLQTFFEHEKIISELFFKQNPSDIIDPVFIQRTGLENKY